MSLLCLVWSSDNTCSNGPDRLISNDNFAPILNFSTDCGELSSVHCISLSGLSFIKLLANASHNTEIVLEGYLDFAGNDLVGLAEDMASLAVAQDDPVETEIFDHLGACFSSIGTIAVERTILSRELDLRAGEGLLSCTEMDEGWCNNNLNLVLTECEALKCASGE